MDVPLIIRCYMNFTSDEIHILPVQKSKNEKKNQLFYDLT
jgi:hypothetical protein